MTLPTLTELGAIERHGRIGEFSSLCRWLALEQGHWANAAATAAGMRAPERVVNVLKAGVAAGGAGTRGMGQ